MEYSLHFLMVIPDLLVVKPALAVPSEPRNKTPYASNPASSLTPELLVFREAFLGTLRCRHVLAWPEATQ